MRALLLDGAASPPSGEADAEYFQALRARAATHKPAKRRA